jgi:hypothetical protein
MLVTIIIFFLLLGLPGRLVLPHLFPVSVLSVLPVFLGFTVTLIPLALISIAPVYIGLSFSLIALAI